MEKFTPPQFDAVQKGNYARNSVVLGSILKGKAPEAFQNFFSPEECKALEDSKVETRMPAKISEWYLSIAKESTPVSNLIKPRPEEMLDLQGEEDPSSQNSYSPVPGLLHKYPEIVLLYASPTCSAHCRYCYRLDLFTGKTGKKIARIEPMIEYIKNYNDETDSYNDSVNHDADKIKFKISEGLVSGGDPMVLPNTQLYTLIAGLAEAGIPNVRIGTKELAFFPARFDQDFFDMIDIFHANYPDVTLNFMIHFSHPDEFLEIEGGESPKISHLDRNIADRYLRNENGSYKWRDTARDAVDQLLSRGFVRLYNQCPIIADVNDHSPALHFMQKELHRVGITNHYLFQCREIEGHRAFAVPVEETLEIYRDAQRGLSGIERTKFAMSTKWGKMEVIGKFDMTSAISAFESNLKDKVPSAIVDAIKAAIEDEFMIFRIVRSPYKGETYGGIIIARSNPEALWISGYEDRIIYDGRKSSEEQGHPLGNLIAGVVNSLGGDLKNFINNSEAA